jgi:hypothetical protein
MGVNKFCARAMKKIACVCGFGFGFGDKIYSPTHTGLAPVPLSLSDSDILAYPSARKNGSCEKKCFNVILGTNAREHEPFLLFIQIVSDKPALP